MSLQGREVSVRVVLVETSDALPGLLPFQAWDALGTADVVYVRDAQGHPSAPHLHAAGLDLTTLEPATLDRADMDLTRPGSPDDRRVAKALVAHARSEGESVFLLGPDDQGVAPALAGMATDEDIEIEIVFFAPQPRGTETVGLVEVMSRLRDPSGGCPWDLQQDHRSLVRYLVEETYELVDAIENGSDDDLREELGDVLLQVVFHAQVASDRGAFGIDDVARGIVDKLVRRHPHVFADTDVDSAADVQANWDELKAEEKGRTGPFDGVPRAMPGLLLLDKLQDKAARRDARWVSTEPVEALRTAAEALADADADAVAELIGDVLAAAVACARAAGVDPERAARDAAARFRSAVDSE